MEHQSSPRSTNNEPCDPGSSVAGRATVEQIHIANKSGSPMMALTEATAIADIGLEWDRYAAGNGTYSSWPSGKAKEPRDITLIEAETLELLQTEYGVCLWHGEHRRNITTRGIALNALVGKTFRIGNVLCVGAELAHPCGYLAKKLGLADLVKQLAGRGGIRARILEGGIINAGDEVTWEQLNGRPGWEPAGNEPHR